MPQISKDQFLFFYDRLADDIFMHCYSELKNKEKAKAVLEWTFFEGWRKNLTGELQEGNYEQFLYSIADRLIIGEKNK